MARRAGGAGGCGAWRKRRGGVLVPLGCVGLAGVAAEWVCGCEPGSAGVPAGGCVRPLVRGRSDLGRDPVVCAALRPPATCWHASGMRMVRTGGAWPQRDRRGRRSHTATTDTFLSQKSQRDRRGRRSHTGLVAAVRACSSWRPRSVPDRGRLRVRAHGSSGRRPAVPTCAGRAATIRCRFLLTCPGRVDHTLGSRILLPAAFRGTAARFGPSKCPKHPSGRSPGDVRHKLMPRNAVPGHRRRSSKSAWAIAPRTVARPL